MSCLGPFWSKYKQKCSFWKIRLSFLRYQNSVTSLQKLEVNQTTTPTKNVELINSSTKRWTDNSNLIRHSVCRAKNKKTISVFWIYSWFIVLTNFGVNLAMSHQAQLICQSHSKNQFPKSYLTLKRLAFFEKYILEREGAKKKKKKWIQRKKKRRNREVIFVSNYFRGLIRHT